jgi:hypothetical protein
MHYSTKNRRLLKFGRKERMQGLNKGGRNAVGCSYASTGG